MKIKIVVKNVGEEAYEHTIINDENLLSRMQKLVGGYIEFVQISDGIFLVCNEEGKLNELKTNFIISDENGNIIDVIVGDVFFTTNGGEESLKDEQVSHILQWLKMT